MSCEVVYPWLWPVIMLAGAMCGGVIGAVLIDLSARRRAMENNSGKFPRTAQALDRTGDGYGE